MVTIGVDTHKRNHTAVAVDGNGAVRSQLTVSATCAGHLELLNWAGRFEQREWAIEDCRPFCRRVTADLLRAGETVVPVPPKLMAGARRSAREPGKSDPIDATAVARARLREPGLPLARLDGQERELRLLVDRREDLVAERTGHASRLRAYLHELEPGWDPEARSLDRRVVVAAIEARLEAHVGVLADIARAELADISRLNGAIVQLEREIRPRVAELAPSLLTLQGCGALTAAKLLGETAGIERFRSPEAFARHTGTAPIPVWSGNTTRHRLSRGGNRQLNACLHRIAITQLSRGGPGRAYVDRRLSRGNSKTEAIRLLRRQLSDEVYRRLRRDLPAALVIPVTPFAVMA